MPKEPSPEVMRDVAAISRLSAVPTILRVIAETTGLGFTLVARVTNEEWIACAVHDEISFGLKPGGTLDLTFLQSVARCCSSRSTATRAPRSTIRSSDSARP